MSQFDLGDKVAFEGFTADGRDECWIEGTVTKVGEMECVRVQQGTWKEWDAQQQYNVVTDIGRLEFKYDHELIPR
jgi:hypothetical protein